MIAKAIAAAALIALAPIQCAHDPDPNARREDSPGDALWTMSQKFEAEHNDTAAKETLEYLVAQYPSSRHADAAKDEIAKLGGASTAAPVDRGDAGNSG
jgi:hypothetical protein